MASMTYPDADTSSYSPSTAEKLKQLGDPSGQQNAKYWDEWFDIVCREQNHQPFEWYTGTTEVARILKYHLNNSQEDSDELAMIHPGSGTSLLPLKLQKDFPRHRQVVLDISEIALEEMRQIHEAQHNESSSANDGKKIDYLVSDVLNPPLEAIKGSSCEVWIDKGFIDAVFCSPEKAADKIEQKEQARKLFCETNRLLCPEGIALIVTLVEDHSLQIIIDNWIGCSGDGGSWDPCLHVWEMIPVSGTLRPLGFVLTKSEQSSNSSENKNSTLRFHRRIDNVEEDISLSEDGAVQDMFQAIRGQIVQSRANFELELKRQTESDEPAAKQQTVLTTLELKPCEAVGQEDLKAMESAIRSYRWKRTSGLQKSLLDPKWHPFTTDDKQGGGEPRYAKIVPIGFGISKLLMQCIIATDDLDDLVMEIEEWGETEEADKYGGIGSVEVESTVPVGDAMDLFSKNRNK